MRNNHRIGSNPSPPANAARPAPPQNPPKPSAGDAQQQLVEQMAALVSNVAALTAEVAALRQQIYVPPAGAVHNYAAG